MALAQAQIAPNAERRRSERRPLALPMSVRGVSLDSKSFQEETFTLSVSAHGALLALATTVTLGQTLFLRNPQTQDEAGAWVTRFGVPRGGLAQVGIEFVRPDADFWAKLQPAKSPMDGAEWRPEEEIHVLPHPAERGAVEAASPVRSEAPPAGQATTDAGSPAKLAPTEVLLHALEETLRRAAEQAVAAAATSKLTAAVNQAAAAIENFSQARVRQLEERFLQHRQELAASAREEFHSQIQPDVARINQFHEQVKGEMERAAAETREIVESQSSQMKESYRDWEARLRSLQEELANSKEQEVAHFRERLRNILTTLLSSLG